MIVVFAAALPGAAFPPSLVEKMSEAKCRHGGLGLRVWGYLFRVLGSRQTKRYCTIAQVHIPTWQYGSFPKCGDPHLWHPTPIYAGQVRRLGCTDAEFSTLKAG